MQYHVENFFSEFRQLVDLLCWSLIKAPAAFIAARAFFSMLSNPANVAVQSMQIVHNGGGLPAEVMTGVVTAWFLCACTVLSMALVARVMFKVKLFQSRPQTSETDHGAVFHP